MKLSEGQRRAIQQAANAPVMVLTGGPGCGKTFATATVVKLWRAMGRGANKVALCAPTGAHLLSICHLVYDMKVLPRSDQSTSDLETAQVAGAVVAHHRLCYFWAAGRAAERLASTARVQASTIHRLLMWVSV